MANLKADGFPWKPRSFTEIMADGKDLFKGTGDKKEQLTWNSVAQKFDYTVLYFSAHWCPPCRNFTPKFAEWYKNNQAKMPEGKTFEVIFCSSDQNEEAFNEYYETMPWATMPYDDPRVKELKTILEVSGIPSVQVIRNSTGKVAEPNGCGGRTGVTSDPNAEKFPWPKEPAGNFMACLDSINEKPVVIVLAGKKDDGIFAALTEVGKPLLGASGEMKMEFAIEDGSTPAQLQGRIKNLFQLKDEETIVVSDLGEGQFWKPEQQPALDKIDADFIKQLVKDFEGGKLVKTKL